ncbi:MAG: hypothetical protein WA001_02175 [Patescibacteria group bacterium]
MRRDAAPKSERPPFPLVMGLAMNRFLNAVVASKQNVLPIVIGENSLELRAFINEVGSWKQVEGRVILVNDRLPDPLSLDRDDVDALVFMDGGKIPLSFQLSYAEHRYRHLKYVMPIIEQDANAYRIGLAASTVEHPWHTQFFPENWRDFVWPSWQERRGDQVELVTSIYRRLSMPNGLPVPTLDEAALTHIMSQPFRGTHQVNVAIKQALSRYIRSERKMGVLLTEHFKKGADEPPSSRRHSRREVNPASTRTPT